MWLLFVLGMFVQERPLAVTWDPVSFRPTVRIGAVLAGSELQATALAGVPVRVRVRVELWKDRMFDQLVDSVSWSSIIVYEPIGEQFFVRTLPAAAVVRAASFTAARAAVETEFRLDLHPRERGRYYYTAAVQIETLSLSDLQELERWLQGELQPAVTGQRSVPGAIGQGAKRLLLRLLDLPARRYDARTGRFRVP